MASVKATVIALAAVGGLTAADATLVGEAKAQYASMSCDELWFARNNIYAQRGYCFQTERARRVFGRGCFAPYGRLSLSEQQQVQQIQYWEARKGCS